MKNEWKTYINSLPFKTVFLHRDEFGEKPHPFISADEINKQKSLKELKQLIQNKIATL